MATSVPQVIDTGRRVARTAVQVLLGFGSFALVWPVIVATIISTLHLPKDSKITVLLLASAAWVTGASLLLTKLMAIPAVNTFLERVRLGGQSTTVQPQDSWTTLLQVQPPAH